MEDQVDNNGNNDGDGNGADCDGDSGEDDDGDGDDEVDDDDGGHDDDDAGWKLVIIYSLSLRIHIILWDDRNDDWMSEVSIAHMSQSARREAITARAHLLMRSPLHLKFNKNFEGFGSKY